MLARYNASIQDITGQVLAAARAVEKLHDVHLEGWPLLRIRGAWQSRWNSNLFLSRHARLSIGLGPDRG